MLYEMLTGKVPFARAGAMSTMAAIVEEQAPPMGELNPSVPVPLRRRSTWKPFGKSFNQEYPRSRDAWNRSWQVFDRRS
jgi:hypothetical protein